MPGALGEHLGKRALPCSKISNDGGLHQLNQSLTQSLP
jgi:hypothetical protein